MAMNLTITHIINHAAAEVLVLPRTPERLITGLAWDSRSVTPQSLFVAIVGEHVNGNDYLVQALENGAGVLIASEPPSQAVCEAARAHDAALLYSHDALASLEALARSWRETLTATVVGVTGSSGKTTTKDLIAAVLATRFATHATAGNRNSEIGLSATILAVAPEHELIVCEMGMQQRGEIAALSAVAQPHIGVITNIGVAHCEIVGSRENIARAKAELLEALPSHTGVAILPGDDAFTPELRGYGALDERSVRIITYGMGAHNDLRATSIHYDELGHPRFEVYTPDGRPHEIALRLQGEHNVLNALAAIAVGHVCGVPMENIVAALATVEPAALRQEVVQTAAGNLIINDTYNANPDSMRAALALLSRLACTARRVAVLGDMYELGQEEVRFHQQIGAYVLMSGVDELVCVGALGAEIARGAREAGMPTERVHACNDVASVLSTLEALGLLRGGEGQNVILVKASRGMQLERIVEGLTC